MIKLAIVAQEQSLVRMPVLLHPYKDDDYDQTQPVVLRSERL